MEIADEMPRPSPDSVREEDSDKESEKQAEEVVADSSVGKEDGGEIEKSEDEAEGHSVKEEEVEVRCGAEGEDRVDETGDVEVSDRATEAADGGGEPRAAALKGVGCAAGTSRSVVRQRDSRAEGPPKRGRKRQSVSASVEGGVAVALAAGQSPSKYPCVQSAKHL